MRDYYIAYVADPLEKTQKRANREGAKGAEGSFAPFAPSVDYESPENLPLDLSANVLDEDGPGTDTFEERIAIMMYDGGLTEEEAVSFLTAKLKQKRLSLEDIFTASLVLDSVWTPTLFPIE